MFTALARGLAAGALLNFGVLAQDVVPDLGPDVPSETAAREILKQSADQRLLRLFGLDFFPRAAGKVIYDDNILISPDHPIADVEWTLSPGLTLAVGDVAACLPDFVTVDQLRSLLEESLDEDSAKPRRYVALDYSPSFNFFTDQSRYNNVDHDAKFSAGYGFDHLALGLDQDFSRRTFKDNWVGDRITASTFDTKLRGHYETNERSSFDINFRYYRFEYEEEQFQGYDEFRNEDWYNRHVGAHVSLGAGVAFGLVRPDRNADQLYQQALVRALYNITGKLDLKSTLGVEWRQYGAGQGDDFYPVFSLAAIYRPLPRMTVTLEGHRYDEPAYYSANYNLLGFSVGIREVLFGRLSAGLSAGYDHITFTELTHDSGAHRKDDYLSIRASLDYALNRRWTTSLYYQRRQDSSSDARYTYENNIIGTEISWHF